MVICLNPTAFEHEHNSSVSYVIGCLQDSVIFLQREIMSEHAWNHSAAEAKEARTPPPERPNDTLHVRT